MSQKQWKVAVIGCGMFANGVYLPNISREANAILVGCADIIFERAEQPAKNSDARMPTTTFTS